MFDRKLCYSVLCSGIGGIDEETLNGNGVVIPKKYQNHKQFYSYVRNAFECGAIKDYITIADRNNKFVNIISCNHINNILHTVIEMDKTNWHCNYTADKFVNILEDSNDVQTRSNLEHIKEVKNQAKLFIEFLDMRAKNHDHSKLISPEKEGFKDSALTETLTYDSPEYKASLEKLKETLDHHYKWNSHHPQHYENGIDGMTLFDIVEMYLDWRASVKRYKDGSIEKSIDVNKDRFKISDQLYNIFKNTNKLYKKHKMLKDEA